MEWLWAVLGVLSAAGVWLSVHARQLSDRNPLVRLGDCTYGLYLLHVPLMLVGFHVLTALGWLAGFPAGV